MTRPSWALRLLRACLAAWLLLSGGELGLVHACPMHAGAPPSAASTHDAGAARHASHQAHDGGAGEHGAPASTHACTCVGTCPAASALATLPDVATAPLARVRIAPRRGVPEGGVARVPGRAYALPFANGPPASALAA